MNKETSTERFLDECKEEFRRCYEGLKSKKIVLFGAGSYGILMIRGFKDIGMYENIYAVCDNDEKKWGGMLEGIQVRSIDDVIRESKEFVVVISSQYEKEIRNSLIEYSLDIFTKSVYQQFVEQTLSFYVYETTHIVNDEISVCTLIKEYHDNFMGKEEEILSLLEDEESKNVVRKRIDFYKSGELRYIKEIPVTEKEYFDREYYNHIGEDEVFIDCGAYIGDTVEKFVECVGDKYSKIYAFEPDSENFKRLCEQVAKKGYNNVELYKYATGKENGELKFNQFGTMGSAISEEGEAKVEVKSLDEFIIGKVSWVKMDIEGAEYETLQGMEKIIKRYKPKLAICIYHKCEDLFRLPLYLHTLVPEYKFKIRHHDYSLLDTVLYADIYNE